MKPEQLAEIEARNVDSLSGDAPHNPDVWTLNADRVALLAEVKRLDDRLREMTMARDVMAQLYKEVEGKTSNDRVDAAEKRASEAVWDRDRAREIAVALEQENARQAERLKAAEDTCLMVGWSAAHHETDREKAAYELWSRWADIVGPDFRDPAAHPDLSAEVVADLARQRDETRAKTLAKIRGEGQ